MKTFEEIAKGAVIREVGVFDDIGYCRNDRGQKTCREEHERGCPFHDVDIEALLAWANGKETQAEVWEVTTQDGNRHRSLLSPGTTLAELVQMQGQPVVELRRLDPPAPRMQPIPTVEDDDERIEDF